MRKILLAAALAGTALTGTNAAAATLVDFTINTDLDGQGIFGSPTTAKIAGTFDYDALGSTGTSNVSNFAVLLGSLPSSPFTDFAGVTATLTNLTPNTGTLNFSGNGQANLFSFNLSNFAAFGTTANTVTNATTFNFRGGDVAIDGGLNGTIGVAAAVPEPATWAMMFLGFGLVGFGMRRRRAAGSTTRVRYSFA